MIVDDEGRKKISLKMIIHFIIKILNHLHHSLKVTKLWINSMSYVNSAGASQTQEKMMET